MVTTGVISILVWATAAIAQLQNPNNVDLGNGVHVPGQIPANLYEPLQPRLAYAGATGMTVSWSTFVQITNPQVSYGLSPDALNTIVNASEPSTTYPTSRTWNNHVKVTGLQPATKYYYKVSYADCAYCSYVPTYTFRTARVPGDTTPFTIAAFADMGVMGHMGLSTTVGPFASAGPGALGSNETNTLQSLLALQDTYEFMAHFGDIGYADSGLGEAIDGYFGTGVNQTTPSRQQIADTYESMLEQYFDQFAPITSTKPWMVLPGNHEANCDNGKGTNKIDPNNVIKYNDTICFEGQRNFTFYKSHYRMPSAESKGVGNFWYSMDVGMTHMVFLDTETDLGHGLPGGSQKAGNDNGPFGSTMNQQLDWLVADLKAVDRSKTPWLVVGLHRPWYTSASPSPYPVWQEAFETIFYDYNVDLYITGHNHVYERFDPIYNYTVDPRGLDNPRAPLVIGNGVAGHYAGLDPFTVNSPNGRVSYSAYGTDKTYGWGRLTFHNVTHLTYEFIASANSTVLDTVTLYKAHDYPDLLTNSSDPSINGVAPNNVYSTSAAPGTSPSPTSLVNIPSVVSVAVNTARATISL